MSTCTLNKTISLTKRGLLAGLAMPGENAVSIKIDGPHGEGKTATAHAVAKALGGYCLVVEGGSLKEGEMTGIPFAQTNSDGSKEVDFVPYYQTAAIQRLQKKVYETAKKGFLGGDVKLEEDGTTTYKVGKDTVVLPARDIDEIILAGEQNKYQFGDDLPYEVKLRLLKTGAIKPVVLFFDEINRTDTQTAKELMNIILTKSVNGYKFPWWVFVMSAVNPAGQDSVYATNEMDAAQMDRFLTIQFGADIEEWTDYAIDSNFNPDYIVALNTNKELFTSGIKNNENDYEVSIMPTPRSHTICQYIYSTKEIINASGFMTPEEIGATEDHIRILFEGKIGRKPAAAMIKALRNKEDYIDPEDLIDGKGKTLKDIYVKKISNMKSLSKRILINNLLKTIASKMIATFYDQTDKDLDKAKKAKDKWTNMMAQLKQFFGMLEGANQNIFATVSFQTNVALTDPKYAKYCKDSLFKALSSLYTVEIIEQLSMKVRLTASGDIDRK